jgi:hypothetical protein
MSLQGLCDSIEGIREYHSVGIPAVLRSRVSRVRRWIALTFLSQAATTTHVDAPRFTLGLETTKIGHWRWLAVMGEKVSGHPRLWCPRADWKLWGDRPSLQRVTTLPAPSILAPGPFGDTMASQGGFPSRPRVEPLSRVASALVGRLFAGQLALHMAPTMRGCGASTTSPPDSKSRPKALEPFKGVPEKAGGVASVAWCSALDSLPTRGPVPSTPAISNSGLP